MHDPEKSDPRIVATGPTNKAGRPGAEWRSQGWEPRGTVNPAGPAPTTAIFFPVAAWRLATILAAMSSNWSESGEPHQQREVHRAYRTPDAVGWPMIRTGLAMCWASRRCYTIRSHACNRIVIPEQER